MLRDVANLPMGLGDSLLLSGIGMLVVFMELIILSVMILLMSKAIASLRDEKKKPLLSAEATGLTGNLTSIAAEATPSSIVTLQDVTEPAAAAIMAITADKMGVPLSRLAFRSIKGIIKIEGATEEEAAAIMAITADKMGVPVNNLVFRSIKQI